MARNLIVQASTVFPVRERITLSLPYLSDRKSVEAAHDLMTRHGDDAGFEAAAKADRSRDIGNVQNFCRWRQIERLIVLLASEKPVGTLH
jgi:hypothetical protein